MPKKHNPGCRCCATCDPEETDLFERSDSSTLGDPWVEVAEDWELASGKLQVGASDALALFDRVIPAKHHVTAALQGNADGDALRIVADYFDADNYHFGEYTFHNTKNSRSVKVGKRVAGVETIYQTVTGAQWVDADLLDTGAETICSLCLRAHSCSAHLWESFLELPFQSQGVHAGMLTTPFGGRKAALATGAIAGDVTFDAFHVLRQLDVAPPGQASICLCGGLCDHCEELTLGREFQVVLAGVANGTGFGACTDAANFNATWLVPSKTGGQCRSISWTGGNVPGALNGALAMGVNICGAPGYMDVGMSGDATTNTVEVGVASGGFMRAVLRASVPHRRCRQIDHPLVAVFPTGTLEIDFSAAVMSIEVLA